MHKRIKNACCQHPPAYALRPGPFREYSACEGKMSYYFLYEDGHFPNPDYAFFLQTQLLANRLMRRMEGYAFYVQIYVEGIRAFAWEEMIDLAHWKDKKSIKFLSCETRSSQWLTQKFSFLARDLETVSQRNRVVLEGRLDGITGICADYYAIKANNPRLETLCENDSRPIKKGADFALIGDDTHGVWTISHTKEYAQSTLIENLKVFCDIYSSKLYTYI